MFGTESLFPLATARVIDAYGGPLRTRIRTIGKRLSTTELRRMNGEVASGTAAARRRGRLRAPGPPRRLARPASGAAHRGRRAGLRREPAGRPGLRRRCGRQASTPRSPTSGASATAYDALYRNRVQLLVDYGSSRPRPRRRLPGLLQQRRGPRRHPADRLDAPLPHHRVPVDGRRQPQPLRDAARDRGVARPAPPQRPREPGLPPRAGAGPRARGGGRGAGRPAAVHPPRRLARARRARHPGAPLRPRLLRHAVPRQRLRRDDAPRGGRLPGGLPAGARRRRGARGVQRHHAGPGGRDPGPRRPRGPAIPAPSPRRPPAGCCT